MHARGPADEARGLDAVAADLDMAASDLAGPFAAAIRGSLDERLARVGELLRRPLLPRSATGGWCSPVGLLAGTPWSLLDGLTGRPLTIPTSATRWLALRRTPPAGAAGSAWSPARTSRAARRRSPARRRSGRRAGPPGAEATPPGSARWPPRSTCSTWPGTGGTPATTRCSPRSSWSTGRGSATTSTSWATPSVVVLSACELGRVAVRSGEEAVGMSAAWLHAGARTVVSSPALVADDVACEVLAGWHERVSRGKVRPTRWRPPRAFSPGTGGPPSPFLCFGTGW